MPFEIPLSESFLKKIHQQHKTDLTNGIQTAAHLMIALSSLNTLGYGGPMMSAPLL